MATNPDVMKPEEMVPYMHDSDKVPARMFKKFLGESNVQSKLAETKSVVVSLLRDDIPEVLKECETLLDNKLQSCNIPACQSIAAGAKASLDKYRRAFNDNDGEGISNDQSHDLNLLDLLIIKSTSRRDTEKALADMDAAMEAERQRRMQQGESPEGPSGTVQGGSMKWLIIAGVIALVVLLIGLLIWYLVGKKEQFEDEFQKLMIDRVLNQ